MNVFISSFSGLVVISMRTDRLHTLPMNNEEILYELNNDGQGSEKNIRVAIQIFSIRSHYQNCFLSMYFTSIYYCELPSRYPLNRVEFNL